jgi:hypothetical protein
MRYLISLTVSLLALSACDTHSSSDRWESIPYELPAQEIYRIDDHRYFSLEKADNVIWTEQNAKDSDFKSCLGDVYYNDSRLNIRTRVTTADPLDFGGGLIIDDPSGHNIAMPNFRETCNSDRGCRALVAYSVDSGRTFHWLYYHANGDIFDNRVRAKTFVMTADALYVVKDGDPLAERFRIDDQNIPISVFAAYPGGHRSPSGERRFVCRTPIRTVQVE